MLRLCFGAEPEAQAVVARINAIHERVHGHLPETAGIFPAGTSYSAHDPALLAWVHATLLDMNLRVYERFVEPSARRGEGPLLCRGQRNRGALRHSRGASPPESSAICGGTWKRCSAAGR